MTDIIPAILENSLPDIESRLQAIRGAAKAVQIDVADGSFVPNATWPFSSRQGREEFDRMAAQEEGLPLWQEFDFEIDLMVNRPLAHAKQWISAGASRLIVHADSQEALQAVQGLQEMRGGELGVAVGIALPCDAELSALAPFADLYDYVQVMGIARIGFQGERFDERAFSLVSRLRAEFPGTIQIDGGVRRESAHALAQAGADRLVAGSSVFGSADPKQALRDLREEANRT
jgi:ribulose-phosphate 3-epimerase